MTKSPHAFRSIGEVARLVGVATHVLRYWESQFPALSPVKRPDGRRYYRPEDVQLAAGLCEVMREDGLTIRGANLLIDKDKGAALRARGRARLGVRGEDAATAPGDEGGRVRAARKRSSAGGGKAAASRGRAAADGTAAETVRPVRQRRSAGDAAETLPLFPDLFSAGVSEDGTADAGAELVEPARVGERAAAKVREEKTAAFTDADDRQTEKPLVAAPDELTSPAPSPGNGTDGILWLTRLTATAAALRIRRAPLPEGAAALAEALRMARQTG